MGVDWIPCRVEEGCPAEELDELVRLEAIHFRTGGSSIATELDPRCCFSEAEWVRIRQSYLELGPLHRRLLFKRDSHRVSVVGSEVLFPVEWRIGAERTILPWELGGRLAEWRGYREEVRRGAHRPFLEQLHTYVCLHHLATVDLANYLSVVQDSLLATGGWATNPEVVACRAALLAEPIFTLPPPPQWPAGEWEADPSLAESAFAKVESSVAAWNRAVYRGNRRLRLPKRPLEFEEWISVRLNDGWFESFLTWVKPWEAGGYGLYRDCE